jgi:hypothetical protein
MPSNPHHGWNVSRQQGEIALDGLSLFRVGVAGRIQERRLRLPEVERIEAVAPEPGAAPSRAASRPSLRVHLKGGRWIELLTSVEFADLRQARAAASGLERLLHGEAESPLGSRPGARALCPRRPWRPNHLRIEQSVDSFSARWGYLRRTRFEANPDRLRVCRAGRTPIELDCDDVVALRTEPEVSADQVRYRLVAELRRGQRIPLLDRLPDPVFAGLLAREAALRLGLG